jgi:ACDE family multidrug resistance protein
MKNLKYLLIIYGITLMAVLGLASTTPAFPGIAESLNVPKERIGWLLSAFVIPGVFLTPVFGIMADRYGRKKVLVPALFLFSIAGGMVGFARSFELLIALTFLQGIGAASLGALNVTLIGDIFREKRSAVMGYNNSVMSIGTATYPLIGGFLAGIAWYYPFFLPFIGLPIAFFVWFGLDYKEPKSSLQFKEYINITLNLLKQPKFFSLFLISIATFIMLFGVFLTYIPFVVTDKFGLEPKHIGFILATMSGSTVIFSLFLGKLTREYSNKIILTSAFILYATAIFLMIEVNSFTLLFIPAILYGMAQGVNQPNIQSMLAGLAPDENRAVFMSLNRSVVQLGQASGPLLMGLIYSSYHLVGVFYTGAIIAIFMVLFIILFIKN